MKKNTQAYCAFGGLSAFFALEYVGVLAAPPFASIEFPLLSALTCNIVGVVCGVLAMKRTIEWHHKWMPPLIVALLTLAGGGLRLGVALDALPLWSNGVGSFVSGLFFPLLLRWLMNTSRCPGFMLAGAVSLGELTRLYTLFVPIPIDTNVAMYLSAGYQCAVGLFSVLCLRHPTEEPLQPSPPMGEKIVFSEFDITNFMVLGLFFLPLSFLLDILFYREQLLLVPQMVHLHLFIWVGYMLCGLLFDNNTFNKQDIFLTLVIVLCASVLFVSNTGIGITLLYCFSYAVELTARCCAFIFLTLLAQRPECASLYPKFDTAYVYVVQCATFIIIFKTFPTPHTPDIVYISGIVLPVFLMYAAYCIYTRIAQEKKQDAEPARRGSMHDFAAQYDLSPREIEVLQQIVAGRDTDIICTELHVSRNTVKTHIRQILRKVNSKNRNELLVVFFDFCMKTSEDDSLETSTS